jgi:hypothetical protein
MDYRVASNIRGKSLSSLMTDKITSGKGVGSALGGAISDKLRARATGVKEKFDPMNIAKFMTGGSRLAPAILGRITGRSQSDINYFAGDKKTKNSYTQIPTSMSTPGEGLGGSAVEVLNKMLSFMQRSREQDLKKKQTTKQFIEEQKVEEQRRHNEFLKILKQYTSLNTATIAKKEEGPDTFDFLKDMIGGMIDKFMQPFKWLWDNKDTLLRLLGWAAGPIGLALLGTGAIVWLAEQLKDYFRKNVVNMNALSPEKAAELLQTPGAFREIEKYGGREAVMKIAKEGHLEAAKILATGDIKKINDAGGKDFLEQVVARGAVTVPESAGKQDLSQFTEQGPKRPTGTGSAVPLKQEAWDKKWSKIYDPQTGKRLDLLEPKPVATQADVRKIDNAAMATPVMPTQADVRKIDNTTMSTPVPQTPVSSRMNDAVQENQDLNISSPGNTQTASAPIISTNTNSVDLPDRPIPATATVRDKTPILDYVLEQYSSPI